jgi:hypothetical protein
VHTSKLAFESLIEQVNKHRTELIMAVIIFIVFAVVAVGTALVLRFLIPCL